MALIHPSTPLPAPTSLGAHREREVLNLLAQGLPDSFDVFHNLNWSSVHGDRQQFGEIDLAVVSPLGHVLLLEVKAGEALQDDDGLHKRYGGESKNIGHQVRRMHSALAQRMNTAPLSRSDIQSWLVLPDHRLTQPLLAYARDCVVDAGDFEQLCSRITARIDAHATGQADRAALMDFLSNRFDLVPDTGSTIEQVQRSTRQMASGLATWVSQIEHESGVFQIEATAGSGKTQLAVKLLQDSSAQQHRALYLCFNRPLADFMRGISPVRHVECINFHQLCRDWAEQDGLALDFEKPGVFAALEQHFLQAVTARAARFDLVIVDESQDFESEWVGACVGLVKPGGRLYVMGDPQQQVYDREPFDIAGAVKVRCSDNFRSPRKVVQAINQLGLVPQPLVARSGFEGQVPHIRTATSAKGSALTQLEDTLQALWHEGYQPSQVAVVCWGGSDSVKVLAQQRLAGKTVRHFTGQYKANGDQVWTEGELLVESLRRFKGQSAPVVVLYNIDFETVTDAERRKLFVGLTRGQLRVDLVLSERAARALLG